MMKTNGKISFIQFATILAIVCTGLGFSGDLAVWQKRGRGIYELDVQKVAVDPSRNGRIYAGTSRALYKSYDGGKRCWPILRLSGEAKGINDIYIPPEHSEIIYTATEAGLYESVDEGKTWNKIYTASDAASRSCLSVFRDSGRIYVGTRKGLFYKRHSQTQWSQIKESFGDEPVYHIVGDNDFLYFALSQSVIAMEKQAGALNRVFSLGIGQNSNANARIEQILSDEGGQSIKFITASSFPYPYVLIASTQGIHLSNDNGKKWERIPTDNFASSELRSLVAIENDRADQEMCRKSILNCLRLVVGTKRGAFFLNDGKWKPVYKGMETSNVNSLAKDARGTVYAATDRGIFYLPVREALPSLETANPKERIEFRDLLQFGHEPGINEVHQMAINYAEVNREKITVWRKQAQRRAWFPDMDIGVDGKRDWSSSDSIWGSYSGGGQHHVGPDDKIRGEDIGWDVSLSWDFADLIWSTDQTTIDSRSKLMVELREDILNEITRLYFERRRNQIELVSYDFEDWRLKIDKEMRVAELTALIDALTGGGFSKEIEEKQRGKDK